jgi:2-pyrone-4,6-dicarboxylate lactonase
MTELKRTYWEEVPTPQLKLPALSCDAHCHIFGPADRFPYLPERSFTPVDAPKEKLFALHQTLGIERCVIVQTALHGFDNSVVVDAMQARPGTYLGVALASAKVTSSELKEMYQQGFRGVRFNFMAHLKNSDSMEDILELSKRLEPLGMHLQVHFSSNLVHELAPQLKQSAAPVMIDHMGRVDANKGPHHEDFEALLKLMDDPKMHMKVSGVDRIVNSNDYTAGATLAKILVDRFTEKCVWGTDWPHPNHHHIPHDEILVNTISQIADSEKKIEHIMVSNPEIFYQFKHQ